MSGALTAFSAAATVVEGIEDVLLLRSPRSISGPFGFILPDCVVEESGRDELQITEHPVEVGSVIADHAYKKPREVTLRWSWSNSGYGFGGFGLPGQSVLGLLSQNQNRAQEVYQQLLALQEPPPSLISITTGKSLYLNMLIVSLGITTNSTSEYALQAVMVCREVIIVSTEAAQITPASAQSSPQTTAAVAQRGAVQPQAQASTFTDTLQTGNVITRIAA